MEHHHARLLAGRHAERVRHAEPDGPLARFSATGVAHPDLAVQLRQWIVVYRQSLARYPPPPGSDARRLLDELQALLDHITERSGTSAFAAPST
jgi:hypothetical protein